MRLSLPGWTESSLSGPGPAHAKLPNFLILKRAPCSCHERLFSTQPSIGSAAFELARGQPDCEIHMFVRASTSIARELIQYSNSTETHHPTPSTSSSLPFGSFIFIDIMADLSIAWSRDSRALNWRCSRLDDAAEARVDLLVNASTVDVVRGPLPRVAGTTFGVRGEDPSIFSYIVLLS